MPALPPPALVAKADPHPDVIQIAKELGVPVSQLVKASEAHSRATADVRSFVDDLNRAPTAGRFAGGATLTYTTTRDVSLRDAVREVLRLPDDRLITEGAVSRLIAANKADVSLSADLTRLRDALPDRDTAIPLGKGKAIVADTADGLLYQALHNRIIIAVLDNIPEAALSPTGKVTRTAVLTDARKFDIHRSVQGLGLGVERENSILMYQSDRGMMPVQVFPSGQLRELRGFGERAGIELPAAERDSVAKIVRKAEAQAHATVIEASVRAAEHAEMRSDSALAVRHLAAAIRVASLLGNEPRGADLLVDTHEKARLVMAREFGRDIAADKSLSAERIRARIGDGFQGADAEAVIAQSFIRATQVDRIRQLGAGRPGSDSDFSKRSFSEAAGAYDRALAILREKDVSKTTAPERALVYEATAFLLERAFTEKQTSEMAKLLTFHEQVTAGARRQGFDGEAVRQERSLQVRLARAAFEAPAEYREIVEKLGVSPRPEKAARHSLLELVERRVTELTAQRDEKEFSNLPAERQRGLLQDLTSAQVSLSRIYVFCVVSRTFEAGERSGYYDRLAALNESVLIGERKIIEQLKTDVARVKAEKGDGSPEYAVVSAELKARQIGSATLLVQQAEVALLGNVPDLTRKAAALIAELKAIAKDGSKEVEQLVLTFEGQYRKGGLEAAVKEFLSEVNKDYPPYVLAAMIGAGILGGLGGYSRWGRQGAFCGFMFMSCLVMGGVKVGYTLNGIGPIQAAHETGLVAHSRTQDFLNVCYLLADVAQAAPIVAAAFGLRKLIRLERTKGKDDVVTLVTAEEEKQRNAAVRLFSAVFTEIGGSLRTAGSMLNPLKPMSGLMYITLGTAMAQLLTSNLPNAVLNELVGKFGLEVGATLFIAFIYERIAANLDENHRGNKAGALKGTVDALNGTGGASGGDEPGGLQALTVPPPQP